MSMQRSAIAILLALLLALPLHVQLHAQAELPRHTPGFPEVEKLSLEELRKVLSQLDTVETLSQLQNNPQLRESIAENIHKLEAGRALKPEDAKAIEKVLSGSASVSELTKLVEDPDVRSTLNRLAALYNERGSVPREHIENALKIISSRYSSGRISAKDYLLALEILKRFAELSNENDLASLLDRESLKVLKELVSGAYMSKLTEFLSSASNIVKQIQPPQLPEYSNPVSGALGAFPNTAFSTLPSFPLATLLPVIGIVVIVILLAFFVPRITSFVRRSVATLLVRKAMGIVTLKGLPKPVELYWRSVERIAAITGMIKRDTQTHREYLKAVEGKLGELSKPFREITQGYEIVRFGGILDPEIEKHVEEEYYKLVRKR